MLCSLVCPDEYLFFAGSLCEKVTEKLAIVFS